MVQQRSDRLDGQINHVETAPSIGGLNWPKFYEKMRIDIIEAQCALSSGQAYRAIELMEEMLQDAAFCDQRFTCDTDTNASRSPAGAWQEIGTHR